MKYTMIMDTQMFLQGSQEWSNTSSLKPEEEYSEPLDCDSEQPRPTVAEDYVPRDEEEEQPQLPLSSDDEQDDNENNGDEGDNENTDSENESGEEYEEVCSLDRPTNIVPTKETLLLPSRSSSDPPRGDDRESNDSSGSQSGSKTPTADTSCPTESHAEVFNNTR